ncbi:MAG: GNAT family N-acetyltransferase [Blautia sp.]
MDIHIRTAKVEDYNAVEAIMKQVHKLHVGWRPDVYKQQETILPLDEFKQAIQEQAFFVAEGEGKVVGILGLMYRHVETPVHVTKDIIFIDSMAVDEPYRKKGVGHAFFDFLKELKIEKGYDAIELQVNARNKVAYDMYRSYGFTEKSINMELLETK